MTFASIDDAGGPALRRAAAPDCGSRYRRRAIGRMNAKRTPQDYPIRASGRPGVPAPEREHVMKQQ